MCFKNTKYVSLHRIYVVEHFSVSFVTIVNTLDMDIFYYKVNKESELGQKASALLAEMIEVESKADDLADTYGAKEYFMDSNQDAGGMVAVVFPDNAEPNPKVWSNLQLGDNPNCYTPNVRIREELMESEKALLMEGGSNTVVSKQEMTFEQVQFRFSREEAAKMAGVKLTTIPLERIGKRHQIDRRKLNMLSMGVPVETILPDLSEEIKTDIRLSLTEDKQIQDAMKGRMFRLVHQYEGNKKAVAIYEEWMRLPVVPYGTVNALLGVKCDTHRCGLTEKDDWVYITSAVEIENEEFTSVSVEEFNGLFLPMRY